VLLALALLLLLASCAAACCAIAVLALRLMDRLELDRVAVLVWLGLAELPVEP
jgi:hypothetical protein